MLQGIATLLICQLAGEVAARGLDLPVPGPVIGLLVLFGWFLVQGWRGGASPETMNETPPGQVAQGLLQNLSILFVPAAVGVVDQLDILGSNGLALALAIIGSTALSLAVTALVFVAVARHLKRGSQP